MGKLYDPDRDELTNKVISLEKQLDITKSSLNLQILSLQSQLEENEKPAYYRSGNFHFGNYICPKSVVNDLFILIV
jgi:hypothetical protein